MLIEEAVIDQHNTLIRVFLHFVRLVLVRNSAISSLHNREHHFFAGELEPIRNEEIFECKKKIEFILCSMGFRE